MERLPVAALMQLSAENAFDIHQPRAV